MIGKTEIDGMSISDLIHLLNGTDEVIRRKQNELSTVPEWTKEGSEHPRYSDVRAKLNKLHVIRTQIVDSLEERLLGA